MKRFLLLSATTCIFAGTMVSCKKTNSDVMDAGGLTSAESALVVAAGFNGNWAEKTADGNFLIEGDILMTSDELQAMVGQDPSNELIIANEEHYRTTNVVSTPSSGQRTITVRLGSG
ncbi:MAG: hypothetical protein EOO13_05700, partial [Chitinophagaceae bacterium]